MAPHKSNRNRKNKHHAVYPPGPRRYYTSPGQQHNRPNGKLRQFPSPDQQGGTNQNLEPNMAQYVSQEEYEELLKANDELKRNSREMNSIIRDLQRKDDSSQNIFWKLNDEKLAFEQQIMRMHDKIQSQQQETLRERKARMAQEAQTADLQGQLLKFKRGIAASAKKDDQWTDDEIRQKMNQIYYGIQDFVVGILRGRDFDSRRLSREGRVWFREKGFNIENVNRSGCVQVLISLIASVVIELHDPDNLFGLPQSGTALASVAATVARIDDLDVAGFKEWLQSTRKLMQQCNKHATQQADERLLLHECEALKELLGDAILLNWETETPRLVKILAPARDLFRKLHSAKADFEVEMMPVRYANGVATFDTDLMTAIQSDEEETELLGRALQISVFPAVYKHGDEMGQNMEERTIVCKAKVVVQKPNVAAKEDRRIKLEE